MRNRGCEVDFRKQTRHGKLFRNELPTAAPAAASCSPERAPWGTPPRARMCAHASAHHMAVDIIRFLHNSRMAEVALPLKWGAVLVPMG